MNNNNNRMSNIFMYLIPLAIFAMIMQQGGRTIKTEEKMSLSKFIEHLEEDDVTVISSEGSYYTVSTASSPDLPAEVYVPLALQAHIYERYIEPDVEAGIITFKPGPEPQLPWYIELIPTVLVFVVFFIFWSRLMSQQTGGNAKMMNFGKSRAILNRDDAKRVTFADVAGLEEEKEELYEIVDFLKTPKRYLELGARIPKGVLLIGPPGTGKTYLSRAVAGEAGVPFFSISGSDFVEMFVGVGASRVRDLFQDAKKNAPCIVFIDEIDAVGRRRGAGMGGGHDEREQTLNQLLVEMDGFGANEGIIIMAATNRPDILDPALLRPGRFDREVFVGLPDVREREAVLRVHTQNKKLAEDVDLQQIAKTTSGFTPADLENLANEAALLTARAHKTEITKAIFEEAAIKVVAGPAKKSKVVIERERRLTAYHEGGHAIVSRALPDSDPVHMITIIPRGQAGGFTAYTPEEDRSYMTRNGMKQRLITLLGGRAAEALVLDDISTGASNDIERATDLARAMVTTYGMSEKLGPMAYGNTNDEPFLGRDFGHTRNYSEGIAAIIDAEMKKLIDEAYHKATEILEDHMDLLHALAEKLLDEETVDADSFEALYLAYKEAPAKIDESEEAHDQDGRTTDEMTEKDEGNHVQ